MLRTPGWALLWTVLRLAVAVVIVAAITAQLIESISRAERRGDDVGVVAANFFSFFTILSNAATALLLLLLAGWHLAIGRRAASPNEPRGLAVALAALSTYMVITGIVYNVLLRGVVLYPGTEPVPWSNEVLHLIAPVFMVLDLFLAARRRGLAWGTVWIIAAFPIVWVVYTLIRGPLVTNPSTGDPWWYPYPFLNPHNFDNGFGTVAVYVAGIAVAIITIGLFVIWIGRARAERPDDAEARDSPSRPAADA